MIERARLGPQDLRFRGASPVLWVVGAEDDGREDALLVCREAVLNLRKGGGYAAAERLRCDNLGRAMGKGYGETFQTGYEPCRRI